MVTKTLNCVEILLEEGAEPGAATSLGHTPLMQACRAGYKDVAVLLLEKGADAEQVRSVNKRVFQFLLEVVLF